MSAPYDDGYRETFFQMGEDSAYEEVHEKIKGIIEELWSIHLRSDDIWPRHKVLDEVQERLYDCVRKLEDI